MSYQLALTVFCAFRAAELQEVFVQYAIWMGDIFYLLKKR